MLGVPCNSMSAHRAIEAFEHNFPKVLKWESFAQAQFGNHVRYQDLFRQRVGAQPGGQLNCRSEKIVMMLDGFTRGGPDPGSDRARRVCLLMPGQLALNLSCASNCCRR